MSKASLCSKARVGGRLASLRRRHDIGVRTTHHGFLEA
jgi:hypothetical protein